MDTKYKNDENQLLRIKIIKLEKPYLWYKDDVGKEFTAIDFRYERYYKVIDMPDSISGLPTGYITKDCCEIIKVLIKRGVPDFPFKVKILKNSWFPQDENNVINRQNLYEITRLLRLKRLFSEKLLLHNSRRYLNSDSLKSLNAFTQDVIVLF